MRSFLCLRAALLLVLAGASVARAQVITVRGGPVTRIQVAPNTKLAIPMTLDMSAAAGANVASITSNVAWGPSRIALDSIRTAGFGALTVNTSNAGTGSSIVGVFDATGTASTVVLANLHFTSTATPGSTSVLFTPTVAGNAVGANIL